jgi:hypothetical protein
MSTRLHNGQWYVEVERFEHVCRNGRTTELIRWRSQCAECGSDFTFSAPANSRKFEPNRRCQKHKRPGHRVGGRA